jgi:hypothetical protein
MYFGRPNPDQNWEYGSGSRRAKMTHKSEEILSFKVLDVFDQKYIVFSSAVNCFQFLVINTLDLDRIQIWFRIDIKCWIRIRFRIRVETNADRQHWQLLKKLGLSMRCSTNRCE